MESIIGGVWQSCPERIEFLLKNVCPEIYFPSLKLHVKGTL